MKKHHVLLSVFHTFLQITIKHTCIIVSPFMIKMILLFFLYMFQTKSAIIQAPSHWGLLLFCGFIFRARSISFFCNQYCYQYFDMTNYKRYFSLSETYWRISQEKQYIEKQKERTCPSHKQEIYSTWKRNDYPKNCSRHCTFPSSSSNSQKIPMLCFLFSAISFKPPAKYEVLRAPPNKAANSIPPHWSFEGKRHCPKAYDWPTGYHSPNCCYLFILSPKHISYVLMHLIGNWLWRK